MEPARPDAGAGGRGPRLLTAGGRELVLASGLSAALFAAGALVPLVGAVAGFFAAVPLIVLAARRGALAALLAAAAGAGALLAAGLPPMAVLLYLVEHGAPGAGIGARLGRGGRLFPAVATAAVVVAALGAVAVAAWTAGGGTSPAGVVEQHLAETIAAMSSGTQPAAELPTPEEIAAFVAGLWALLPGIAVAGLLIEYGLGSLLAIRFLLLSGGSGVRPPDLTGFRVPDRTIWLFIASLALAWAPHPAPAAVGRNAAIPLALVYLLQGLAVSLHYAARVRISRLGAVLIAIVVALQPYLLLVPFLLGVLDFRFDFRRRGGPAHPPAA